MGEGLILLLIGVFWLAIRFSFWGGICMIAAGVLDFFFYPSPIVAIPLLGAVVALLAALGSEKNN